MVAGGKAPTRDAPTGERNRPLPRFLAGPRNDRNGGLGMRGEGGLGVGGVSGLFIRGALPQTGPSARVGPSIPYEEDFGDD